MFAIVPVRNEQWLGVQFQRNEGAPNASINACMYILQRTYSI